jgi:hypothetical protein
VAQQGSDSVNRFGRVLSAALKELELRQVEIDDLNVFPVADGDTGRNMVMTLRGLVQALESLRVSIGPVDLQEVDRDLVVKAVARAALSSAHGNSGVILSQLIRGAARELGSGHGQKVSPHLLGKAMRGAADQGMASIPEPREGTILTVVRDIADALESAYPDAVLIAEDISQDAQDAMLADALELAVVAGTKSVDRGPDLMELLREKGVVDAGGYGLVVLLAGALAALRGQGESDLAHRAPTGNAIVPEAADERYSHCVNFTVTGSDFDPKAEAERLRSAAIGDSVLVVGDSEIIRVHVHTDDPPAARALFEQLGTIEGFEQEDMNEQIRSRDQRLSAAIKVHALLLARDAEIAELIDAAHVSVGEVNCEADDHAKVEALLAQVEFDELVIISTCSDSLELAGQVLLSGGHKGEIVDARNAAAGLLAVSAMVDWDTGIGASVNGDRLRAALASLNTAEVELGADGSTLTAVRSGASAISGGLDQLLAQISLDFGQGAFVTAIVSPSGPLDEATLLHYFSEVDVSEALLGGLVAVLAAEA